MTSRRIYVDGKPVQLGKRIGKGGEGEIYTLADDPNVALKLYTVTDAADREQKIAAMISAGLARSTPVVAFPIAIARRSDGTFSGFLMRLMNGYRPLHDLYAPGSRKQYFPRADYRFLVRAATNVARAVASVHQAGCVIGDINHSGMLVSQEAVVALIDADSFQVSDGSRRYLCKVGVPEYTPPELQGQQFGQIVRTANHDAFGLAVVLFQLLVMGRHPFVGKVRSGDIPPIHDAIRQYRYVYTHSRNVGMDQPPGTPSLTDLFPTIASAFEAAFSKASSASRPTAAHWVSYLESLEPSLIQCSDNALHYVPREASECPWCEMEHELGTFLFVPFVPGVQISSGTFDPGAAFDLKAVWARIEAVRCPTRASLTPKLEPLTLSPTPGLMPPSPSQFVPTVARICIVAFTLVLLLVAPHAWILWLLLAWVAFKTVGAKPSPSVDVESVKRRYLEAETQWQRALDAWYARCGLHDIDQLRSELAEAKRAYEALGDETRRENERYRAQRRERQLRAYLERFDIQNARIKGIGPAKQAALSSYGIDTAADVNPARVLAVPGFGPTNSKPLLEWRAKLERRFVYDERQNDVDRQELARIRATLESKAATLRRKLVAGPQNLQALVRRAQQVAATDDPVLRHAQRHREQARVDLDALGVPLPQIVTTPSQPSGSSSARTRASTSPMAKGVTAPHCPRCSSRMVRRIARRGRNAGSAFWGCSRYPTCKGTLSI